MFFSDPKDTLLVARARAFIKERLKDYRFKVKADGVVLVWDTGSGQYTSNHDLGTRAIARIRALAK